MDHHFRNHSDDRCSTWYVFVPAVGYARHWQGQPLPLPPRDDPDKARLGTFLKDFAAAFLDEVKEGGAIPFNRLWCGGDCARVFLAPPTPSPLEAITEKKAQLEDLERAARQFDPQRHAEVASAWQRFRPAEPSWTALAPAIMYSRASVPDMIPPTPITGISTSEVIS